MFESVQSDDGAARLRAAAALPFAALLVALLYLTIYPVLTGVPAALFWTIVAIELAGAVAGAIGIVRVFRRESIHGRAIGWLVAAIAVTLVCVWFFLSLTFPWL